MKILAIETSCDETAVAVIDVIGDDIAVLSNVISSQIELHAQYGGVVPALAAREHAANIGPVFQAALRDAAQKVRASSQKGSSSLARNSTLEPSDIDLIAVTNGPGLGPALLVGLTFARTLCWRWDKPLVGVNHLDGHIHSNWLRPVTEIKNDKLQMINGEIFPALNLIVSGGHTELVMMYDHGDYEIIGETQDDAVGEAFDKVARLLALGYPGGPKISKLAESGNSETYNLPRPMSNSGDFNFSYSGLKTAVLYLIRDITDNNARLLTEQEKTDIAASFQNAAIDVLVQKTRLAAKSYEPKNILLSGGVSANQLLRERLHQMATELGLRFLCPEIKYTTDNAAMIAVAGYFAHSQATRDWTKIDMDANLRLGHND